MLADNPLHSLNRKNHNGFEMASHTSFAVLGL